MRRIFATLKIALRALRRNKMRTILTMLGMIIGVAAVIAMVSIGNGAKSQVEAQIASLGQNVVQIFSGSSQRGGVRGGYGSAGTLTVEDADAVQREIPGIVAVSPEVRTGGPVVAGNQNWNTQILGESPEYFDIRQWPLIQGASFTGQDVRSANKVAILGRTVVDQLFPGDDPVGQIVRIGNRKVPFIVVGVLQSKGFNVYGQDQDDVVIIPYTSAMKRVQGVTALRGINVQVAKPELLVSGQRQITELLRQRHRITPDREDDFNVRNQQEIADVATAQAKTMTWLLAGIACVSLLVGGIGIMNIMLVSVTERTREIGIRMAVGARGQDILVQFLIEATSLSSLGGSVGIALGVSFKSIIKLLATFLSLLHLPVDALSQVANWPTLVSYTMIFIAFFSSAFIGIASGFYPAWKASKLDPIDALRYE